MKTLPADVEAHLKSGVTTLCRCWRLARRDEVVLGFTDHDRDLSFDGVTHQAVSGVAASADVKHASLAVGGLELEGAFSSDSLVDADLIAGDYDGATIELWLVNWQAPDERVLVRRGTLGEVTRADQAFRAEVRGPMEALEAIRGRLFTAGCDADVGDARCGVDLTAPAFLGTGTVNVVAGRRRFSAGGLDAFAAGWFDGGRLVFTSGANAGRAYAVRRHAVESIGVFLDIVGGPPAPIEVGDTFEVTAGCDKRFSTCAAKFANEVDFRGFPHIPGNDVALSYARPGEGNDGSSLMRPS